MIFMFPWEKRSPEHDEEVKDASRNADAVKKAVRKRDKYRCRDCGMTQEVHKKKFGQVLEVHRLIPGLIYDEATTVTLCVPCHGKKTKRRQDAFWAKDLRWLGFNMYDERDAALYRAIAVRADSEGIEFGEMILRLLSEQMEAAMAHDFADLTLTADGL
jgi:hypothetical protein